MYLIFDEWGNPYHTKALSEEILLGAADGYLDVFKLDKIPLALAQTDPVRWSPVPEWSTSDE